MEPTVWGPKLWFIMHTFALSYSINPTDGEKAAMAEFFNNLKYTIPCNKCRIHYTAHLSKNPIENHLDNRDALFKFTVDIHNEVNKTIGKRIFSYEEALDLYRAHYSNEKPASSNGLIYCVIVIFILIIAIYITKEYITRSQIRV
tara:strand:+ start:38 stop:472 length:435 start_codon:yes stop_codon:yes gene_type:complete